MMDYRELRKLKAQLIEKENKTEDELHLLMELQSLSKVIDFPYRCREMCVKPVGDRYNGRTLSCM